MVFFSRKQDSYVDTTDCENLQYHEDDNKLWGQIWLVEFANWKQSYFCLTIDRTYVGPSNVMWDREICIIASL